MPHEDIVVKMARQVLDPVQYRNFVALLSLRKSNDRNVRAFAEAELINYTDIILAEIDKLNDRQLHLA